MENSNIGTEYIKELYANSTLETEYPQPIFIVYRDTVKTFLHEKKEIVSIQSRFWGFVGIELSVVIALITCNTFTDIWFIKGTVIQGTFVAFSVIFGCFILIQLKKWLFNIKKLNIDKLSDDLGKRGTILMPKKKM